MLQNQEICILGASQGLQLKGGITVWNIHAKLSKNSFQFEICRRRFCNLKLYYNSNIYIFLLPEDKILNFLEGREDFIVKHLLVIFPCAAGAHANKQKETDVKD